MFTRRSIVVASVILAHFSVARSPAQQGPEAPADAVQPPSIPQVVMSKQHAALNRVKVGDTMPAIELEQLGGGRQRVAELAGSKGMVVVFWKSDRRMALQELADLGPDVLEAFGKAGVSVVGIAVEESSESAHAALQRADAKFPNLVDVDGSAFAQVGSDRLPRTYLLDPQGKILWFDIEYSLATRRELQHALRALTTQPK
jgi:peroxiredoxin